MLYFFFLVWYTIYSAKKYEQHYRYCYIREGDGLVKVIKRDGREVGYNGDKVIGAIIKAMTEVEGFVDMECAESIESIVRDNVEDNDQLSVEEIQDIVEVELMSHGYGGIAKAYILYRAKREEKRNAMWEMNDLQRDIYNNKYRYEGEKFDHFIERVSGGNKDVGEAMRNQDFSFGGRILAGRGLAGKIRKMTLSNCYVHPQPEDNIESIFDAAKHMARTYSYGGKPTFCHLLQQCNTTKLVNL